jgi:hypothetical protein
VLGGGLLLARGIELKRGLLLERGIELNRGLLLERGIGPGKRVITRKGNRTGKWVTTRKGLSEHLEATRRVEVSVHDVTHLLVVHLSSPSFKAVNPRLKIMLGTCWFLTGPFGPSGLCEP